MKVFVGSRVFYALMLAITVLGVSFFLSRPEKKISTKKVNESKSETISLEKLVNLDSDKDGIFDWEEPLWGTDPNNPDTFGRGLGDEAEIEKMRPSLVGSSATSSGKNFTQTDFFAQQIFSSLTALGQSGNLDSFTLNSISGGVLENILLEAEEKKYYALSDLKVVLTNQKSLDNYRLSMAEIAKKYSSLGLGNEVLIIAQAVEKNKPELLREASKKVPIYEQTIKETLPVVVPSDLAVNHLSVLNSYKNISESLKQLEKIWSDPIAGLIEITRYNNSTSNLVLSLGYIEAYFASRATIIETDSVKN